MFDETRGYIPFIAPAGAGEAGTTGQTASEIVSTKKQGVKLEIQSIATVEETAVTPSYFEENMGLDETVVTELFRELECDT